MKNVRKYMGFFVIFIVAIVALGGVSFAATLGDELLNAEDGWTRINAQDSRVIYTGKYAKYDSSYLHGVRIANGGAGSAQFTFTGAKVRLISYFNTPNVGYSSNVEIKIDGTVVGNYSSVSSTVKTKVIAFEKQNLNQGIHTITITPLDSTTYGTLLFDIDISDADIPSTPNLIAAPSKSKVDLSWDEVADATSYNVKRSTTAGGPYTTIATTAAITYADINVKNGTTYYYVVSAVNSSNKESQNLKEVSATPVAPEEPSIIKGDRAILVINMVNGMAKEYDLSASEITAFVNWLDAKDSGVAGTKAYFTINKKYNVKPFLNRKEYLMYDKIQDFEIKDYNE